MIGYCPCDNCHGVGEYEVLLVGFDGQGRRYRQIRTRLCPLCQGLGTLTEAQRERRAEGQRRRAARLARNVSLAEEAKASGTTAAALSRQEFGRD